MNCIAMNYINKTLLTINTVILTLLKGMVIFLYVTNFEFTDFKETHIS